MTDRISEVIDALRAIGAEPKRVHVPNHSHVPDYIAEVPVERSSFFSSAKIGGFIVEINDSRVVFSA